METALQDIRRQAYQLRQQFQYDQALDLLAGALQEQGQEEAAWALYYELGKTYQEAFEPEQAKAAYTEAIERLRTQSPPPTLFLARSLSALGLLHQDEGAEDAAIRCHEEAVKLLRQLPETEAGLYLSANLKYLGELHQEQGQLAHARESYRPALSLLQQRLGSGEGYLYLEAATVALQLAAVEIELLVQGRSDAAPKSVPHLLKGAHGWLNELDQEDSIVEQRREELARLRFLLRDLR